MEIVINSSDMWNLGWAYVGAQVLLGFVCVGLGYLTFSWVNGVGPFRGR